MMLGTVRGKIIANSALILLILSLDDPVSGLASLELTRSVELLFRNNRMMESISGNPRQHRSRTRGLPDDEELRLAQGLHPFSPRSSPTRRGSLNRDIEQDESLLLQRDLAGLIDSYLEDTEASVAAKRGRDVAAYTTSYESSERSAELARFLIDQDRRASSSRTRSSPTRASARRSPRSSPPMPPSWSRLPSWASCSSCAIPYKLTGPISKLAEAARAVGRGEYDHELPCPGRPTRSARWRPPSRACRRACAAPSRSSSPSPRSRRRLMEERMRVLELDHKLKDAELLALQTQINPHFLFNTLSAGMQLALAEDADRTADFLDNLAAFIRYVLKPPARSVRVSDEIECVERYIWLLRLRFGERYRFELSVDEEVALGRDARPPPPAPRRERGRPRARDREEGGEVRVTVRPRGRVRRPVGGGYGRRHEPGGDRPGDARGLDRTRAPPGGRHRAAQRDPPRLPRDRRRGARWSSRAQPGAGRRCGSSCRRGAAAMIRILVVDDESPVVEGIAHIVRRDLSGDSRWRDRPPREAAIEKAAALSPDIILMDVRMPGISGLDAIREIRKSSALALGASQNYATPIPR